MRIPTVPLVTLLVIIGGAVITAIVLIDLNGARQLGTLVYSSGDSIRSWDCKDQKERRIVGWTDGSPSWSGVLQFDASHILATQPLSHATSVLSTIDTAGNVTRVRSGRCAAMLPTADILYYPGHIAIGDSLVALLHSVHARDTQHDTVGLALSNRDHPGRVLPPVHLSKGRFAFVGGDGAIWESTVHSRTAKRLGFEGMWPLFQLPREESLVCWAPDREPRIWIVDLNEGREEAVPALDGMTGFACDENGDSTIVCVPGSSLRMHPTWDVRVFDWNRRKLGGVIGAYVYMEGRGVWRR